MAQQQQQEGGLVKVDFTALPFVQGSYLALINFTLPVDHCSDIPTLTRCIHLIEEYLRTNIAAPNVSLGYQVTASFTLVHSITNRVNNFTGSFFNNTNFMNCLSGNQFLPYRPETFQGQLLNFANPQEAARKLTQAAADLDTKWQFSQLISIIVNVQSALPRAHAFIQAHHLDAIVRNGRRRTRAHVTTYLS